MDGININENCGSTHLSHYKNLLIILTLLRLAAMIKFNLGVMLSNPNIVIFICNEFSKARVQAIKIHEF